MAPIAQALYAFELRLPDVFVDLEAEAGVEVVGKHPFGEIARIEQAVFRGARASGSFAKGRRENDASGVGVEAMFANEVAGVLVVFA